MRSAADVVALPEPYDRQVATGYPAVEALRAARDRLATARRAADSAAQYRDRALATYITTTQAGREHRARAVERHEQALRDLAAAEAALPSLETAAERQCPAAAARLVLSERAYAATLATERKNRGRR